MGASDYLETAIQKHRFGISSWSAPSTVYLAVSTADPTDDCSGMEEPFGNSYARVAITNDGTEWSESSGTVTNDNDQSFPEATGDWGTLSHWALFDQDRTSHIIDGVDTSADEFTLDADDGDVTGEVAAGTKLAVEGSTGNDDIYTVASSSFDGTNTIVAVQEDVTDGTADGTLYPMGNLLDHAPLDASKSIVSGDTLVFYAGDLSVSLD